MGDGKAEEMTLISKQFLNRVVNVGLKCCMDAADWVSYDSLYELLTNTFENNLVRLSAIRGYDRSYVQSLSDFDHENIRKACEKMTSWEFNLGVNPLKSDTIPTTTRSDLFK